MLTVHLPTADDLVVIPLPWTDWLTDACENITSLPFDVNKGWQMLRLNQETPVVFRFTFSQ